ncbi:type II secretion system F family protein [Planomonospora sp. ID82291]|uniref:type II secretion system F family protein n=1 Tax=Planomonospora sp. ID82291 TaxID=2738136 RepID=UPI0018C37497|nr:type II secretion system F family protein [Planomonospora sp. ID82291]MBG0814020.1 type II secretion system F family protein [Planomonospora sp. ID82291]
MNGLPVETLAAVLTAAAVWLWTSPGDPVHRLRRARPHPSPPAGAPEAGTRLHRSGGSGGAGEDGAGRRPEGRGGIATAAAAALVVFLAVGGAAGAVVGGASGAAVLLTLRRREGPAQRRERDRITADLPLAADLMVACLRAGQPITGALDVTVQAVGGPLGGRLARVSGQLRLGAAPEQAWLVLADDHALAPLARTMSRAALSGAPVADALTRAADDSRHAARAASAAAARRVGIQVVAPLGLCFLPAFVLLGIVPVVAGLAGEVMLP